MSRRLIAAINAMRTLSAVGMTNQILDHAGIPYMRDTTPIGCGFPAAMPTTAAHW
jgi:hypothetical protein